MTNDEIIEGLKAIRTIHNGNYAPQVDEAIKRLSAEPCEDCISRQEAIDKMQELEDEDIKAYGCSIPEGFDGYRAIRALKTLQPVKTKPKTGHWEQYGYSWEDKFKCSECGEKQPKILCGERIIRYWSEYCPKCGADMRESEDKNNE